MQKSLVLSVIFAIMAATVTLAGAATESSDWAKGNVTDIQAGAAASGAVNMDSLNAGCGQPKRLYNVLMNASSQTGDITTLSISEDLDFNGTDDYLFQLPKPISGVCTNGIISCDAGTWNNCSFYKWAAPDGKVNLAPTTLSALGGCFCINKSCGVGLALHNADYVLTKIGEGVDSVIKLALPDFLFTGTSRQGPYMEVFAQKSQGCSGGTPTAYKDYFNNPGKLNADAATNQQNPDEYYSSLLAANDNINNGEMVRTCSVERNVDMHFFSLTDLMGYTGDVGTSCSGGSYTMTETPTTSGPLKVNFTASYYNDCGNHNECGACDIARSYSISHPDRILGGKIVDVSVDDLAALSFNNNQFYSNGVTGETGHLLHYVTQQNAINIPSTAIAHDTLTSSVTFNMWGGGGGTVQWYFELNPDDIQENTLDDCTAYASDTKCSLWGEEVDGVITTKQGFSTGLSPLPSCNALQGHMQTYNECRPWWKKKRTYKCTNSTSEFDFTEVSGRAKFVNDNSSVSGNTISYSDRAKDANGNTVVTTDSMSMATIGVENAGDCAPTCKVQTREQRTDVTIGVNGNMNTASGTNSSTDVVKTYYRTCSDQGVCPVNDGEVIVKNCACMSQFGEAVTSLQAAKNAMTDKICTTGVAK